MNPAPALSPSEPWPLRPHPASPWLPGLDLRVACGAETGGLRLDYALTGDLSTLRLPAPMPPGPADGLWQHTCFEAFVAGPDGGAYREFNFSPSGQWASYRFTGRRLRDLAPGTRPAEPGLAWDAGPGHLRLRAWLPAHALPGAAPWHLGLSAVLEHTDGRLSYWALHHPAPRPDFHDPAGWRRADAPATPAP